MQKIDFEKYSTSSTYVPMNVCLSMQKENAETKYASFYSTTENKNIYFQKYWPSHIYPCQIFDTHGSIPFVAPKFLQRYSLGNNFDNERLEEIKQKTWCLASMCLHIPLLWNLLVGQNRFDPNNCIGWILTYLTKYHIYQQKKRQHVIQNSTGFITRKKS